LWSQQDVEDLLQIYRAAFTGYLVDFSWVREGCSMVT
jgi:hypothetical protein